MHSSSSYALHTDLYQISMMASYFHRSMHNTSAVCEMFVRRLPKNRRFLVVAGLAQVLEYLENLRFTDAQIEMLREVPSLRTAMTAGFIEYLRGFRFEGNVFAMPEGTIAFQNEPLIRVEAPLAQAQLVETFILSAINFQSNIASKAARVVLAGQGMSLMEFGTRRTHPQSAVDVARAAYIAGFDASSNVEAFYRYDVPTRGTMAHMYVMASENEVDAFSAYGKLFPRSTYLVDTYDTMRGVERALKTVGENLKAVRIDSGDLAKVTTEVRAYLDQHGRSDVQIMLSGDLDEYELQNLLAKKVPFNAAGVGTRLATSDDAPSLGGVYKLVQIADRPVAKLSESKTTYPCPHQVYRRYKDGAFAYDHLGLVSEGSYEFVETEPLLIPVVQSGKVIHRENIHNMRARARVQMSKLPEVLRTIAPRSDTHESFYDVKPSDHLLKKLNEIKMASSDED